MFGKGRCALTKQYNQCKQAQTLGLWNGRQKYTSKGLFATHYGAQVLKFSSREDREQRSHTLGCLLSCCRHCGYNPLASVSDTDTPESLPGLQMLWPFHCKNTEQDTCRSISLRLEYMQEWNLRLILCQSCELYAK